MTNAVRAGRVRRHDDGTLRGVRLATEDFEVAETERRTSAAVCLLVDLSYSMVLRDTWGAAKATALALHALVTGQFPQDALPSSGSRPSPGRCRPPSWPAWTPTTCRARTCSTR